MALNRTVTGLSLLLAFSMLLSARDSLNPDQLALLHDSGGWEYLKMSDQDSGIQTEHTCFDGHPHPGTCRGTLNFTPNNTFVQKVYIHHQSVARNGTYQLTGDQLSLFDEFGTRDGPYTVSIDAETKSMKMYMPQIQIDLELEKEYRRKLAPPHSPNPHQ